MVNNQKLVIPVYLRSRIDAADIREVGMGLIDAGFEPVESDTYRVEYRTGGIRSDREVAALPTASEAFVENGSGALFVTYDGFELEAHIEYTDDLGEPDIHLYGLAGAFAKRDVSEADRKRRAEAVVDAVEAVVEITDPWGVTSARHGEGGVSHAMPSSPPAEVSMSRLPWLTVFSPEWCDHLGGRDRLLDTPAWNTRELSTGAVFVRKTELPHEEYRTNGVRDSRTEVAPGDYVFEGWTTANPDKLREQMLATDPRTQLDPFCALEDGEHGEDICLCKGHASIVEEASETDYRGLLENDLTLRDRCQVLKVQRRGDALWLPKTDQFVRRLVDDDGVPIGDRPDDVPPEHEMLSLTILLKTQRKNPPSWYKLEDTDDRSVANMLNRFISRSPNRSIWQERDKDEGNSNP